MILTAEVPVHSAGGDVEHHHLASRAQTFVEIVQSGHNSDGWIRCSALSACRSEQTTCGTLPTLNDQTNAHVRSPVS